MGLEIFEPQQFNDQINIRVCDPDDADSFLLFAKTIASETTHTFQVPGAKMDVEKLRARWLQAKDDDRICYLGAFNENKMVGQVFYERESLNHPWIIHNAKFALIVVKEYWGSGLASALLNLAITELKKVGIKRLEATVRSENKRGIAFYKKMGFEIEGVRKDCAFINGTFQDELYIALKL